MIVEPTVEALERAAAIIRGGGLVAFPTETVYGLGANALDAAAIKRIYETKNRPFASPLIVHVPSEAEARSLAAEWPETAQVLAQKFWPGPLTLVVKKAEIVPDLVTAGLDSVGIRVPANRIALALLQAAGVPIAAPSANLFSQISPTTAEHVEAALGSRVDMVLDGGPAEVGIESTVVSLRRAPPTILRPGMISQSALEAATGTAWESELCRTELTGPAESPGLHPLHYAPRTPFYVLKSTSDAPAGRGRLIELPADRAAYAHQLYAELHKADGERWDWIAVVRPPDTEEWAGVLDRLKRAQHSRADDQAIATSNALR